MAAAGLAAGAYYYGSSYPSYSYNYGYSYPYYSYRSYPYYYGANYCDD